MPDVEKLDQCVMLVQVLRLTFPAPYCATLASALYDLGVRIHPELATKKLEGLGTMGPFQQQRVVGVSDDRDKALMRHFAPHLVDKMDLAEEEKQAVLAELRAKHGNRIAEIEQRLAAAKPEDFEP